MIAATLNWLNVSSQFPVEENIPYSSLTNKSIDPSMTTAYWNALNGQGSGAMWNTNDTIYVFGGVQTPTNALSAYNVTTDRWQDVRVAGGDFNFDVRTGAVSVSVPESGLNFVLGGHVPFFVGGMVRFDASDPADLTWTNETLGNGSFGEEVPNLDSGALVYVPAGEQGVLIAFGGNNVSCQRRPLNRRALAYLDSGLGRYLSSFRLAIFLGLFAYLCVRHRFPHLVDPGGLGHHALLHWGLLHRRCCCPGLFCISHHHVWRMELGVRAIFRSCVRP